MYGATQAVTLNISMAFNRFWHAGSLSKLNSYRIPSCNFDPYLHFSVTDSLEWFWLGCFVAVPS